MVSISSTLNSLSRLLRDPVYLILRLYFGYTLFSLHGYKKLYNLAGTISYFISLSIPFPELLAPIVGIVESAGGLLFAAGYYNEYISFTIILNMLGIFYFAHQSVLFNLFSNTTEFLSLNAFKYFLIALIMFIEGPGRLSLDYLLRRNQSKIVKNKIH